MELSKQVYQKEKLQPPSLDTFKQVYQQLYKDSLNYWSKPSELYPKLCQLKQMKKNEAVKYGAIGIQLVGFYTVGKILGKKISSL